MPRHTGLRPMAAALVAVVVVGGIGEVAAAKKAPPTRPTTTAPRQLTLGIPAPTPPRQQVQVPWGSPSREPLALGFGRVWVGSEGGVAVLDPVSMQQVAGVAIGLPVLSIASSPDGVWILSGGNGYPRLPDESDLPPYHLTRIDPETLGTDFDADLAALGINSSARANRKIRLAASAGVAWVSYGQTLTRIDAPTGTVTTSKVPWFIGHVASDASGLWMLTSGGDTPEAASTRVVHVDRDSNETEVVADLQNSYPWSIASSGDAVWVVAVYSDPAANPRAPLHLVRIDTSTFAVTSTAADVLAVVAEDGEVWVKAANDAVVGQVDPQTGVILRSVEIAVSGTSSSDGYTSPPFAIGDGQIWSAATGSIERTTP